MNNYTEHTWTIVMINGALKELMKTYVKYPPRKLQSEGYPGPITVTQYQRFKHIQEQLKQEGFQISMPTGN
jgi:arylsulfatase